MKPRRWFRFDLVRLSAALIVILWCFQGFSEDRDESVLSPERLAARMRPRLSNGWTVAVKGEQVVVERRHVVEVYNGIALPGFSSDAERREHIRPSVRREKFVISLRLGDRVSEEDYKRAFQRNMTAVKEARKDARRGKLMPDAQFWREHPEYGYRQLPSFDTGRQSIYMDCHLYGAPWQFWDEAVAKECLAVIDDLGKLFRPY